MAGIYYRGLLLLRDNTVFEKQYMYIKNTSKNMTLHLNKTLCVYCIYRVLNNIRVMPTLSHLDTIFFIFFFLKNGLNFFYSMYFCFIKKKSISMGTYWLSTL